jgi:hypothetical protein
VVSFGGTVVMLRLKLVDKVVTTCVWYNVWTAHRDVMVVGLSLRRVLERDAHAMNAHGGE